MATANPRRRKPARRRNAAPAATINPRRKRRNPVATVNPRRRRRNPFALTANPRRRRRNPAVVNPRRRRARRNPAMVNPNLAGIGKFAMAAVIGGVGSSLVSQVIRLSPLPQSGPIGLIAQVLAGFGVAWGLPKILPIKPETANLIGTIVAAGGVANFAAPFLDISGVLSGFMPAPAAGMADLQYSRYGVWPYGNRGFTPPNGLSDVQYIANGEWPMGNRGFAPINGIPAVPYN